MRKLGKGQSVTFFITREIQERIRNCANRKSSDALAVTDVLLWSISETWSDTEKCIPLWAVQGFRHQRQETVWNNKIAGSEHDSTLDSLDLASYFEDEAMSLEKRYLPTYQPLSLNTHGLAANDVSDRQEQIDQIKAKCERFQIGSFMSATLSEEQERELAPEMEQERQAEKPSRVQPRHHTIHPDVLRLVQRGTLNRNGGGFLPAFESFNRSTAGQLANAGDFGQALLVTTDFANTVCLTPDSNSNYFHRPVQWILTLRKQARGHPPVMVVLSPWEANELIVQIENSSHAYLHSYAPRLSLSFQTLQDLRLCTAPPLPGDWTPPPRSLILRLNLFAGQLYFEDMDEYKETCAVLGLSCEPNDGTVVVGDDGFIGKGAIYPECQFTRSPTTFLRVVMSNIRRNCQDISKTHVGRMLAGEILTERDFTAACED